MHQLVNDAVWKRATNAADKEALKTLIENIEMAKTKDFRSFISGHVQELKKKLPDNEWEMLLVNFVSTFSSHVQQLTKCLTKLHRKHSIEMEV